MKQTSELNFFLTIIKAGSLSGAARELGITPPAISKRLAQMEERLGVSLLNRSTRRLSLTTEGELYRDDAMRILAEIDHMEQRVSRGRTDVKGRLRINAPLGFGRVYITPLVSDFVKRHPGIEIQLQLTDAPLNLVDEGFDLGIRFGELPDTRIIARKLAANRRLLCASSAYLQQHGTPVVPRDLLAHSCIVLRQNETAYGVWTFSKDGKTETVKVTGPVTSNDGEVTLNWALDGHGIIMRAEWDIAKYLRSGRLQLVLEDYATPPADIFAVYPERHSASARVRAFTDFLVASFGEHAGASADTVTAASTTTW